MEAIRNANTAAYADVAHHVWDDLGIGVQPPTPEFNLRYRLPP
jgi:hypothetical protein